MTFCSSNNFPSDDANKSLVSVCGTFEYLLLNILVVEIMSITVLCTERVITFCLLMKYLCLMTSLELNSKAHTSLGAFVLIFFNTQ